MDHKKAYERTITEKLGALPLPDLRESIWSRIEDELDADLPPDEGDGGAGPQSPDWWSILRHAGPFAVIVAIVTIIIVNKQKRKNQPVPQINSFPTAQTNSGIQKELPGNKSAPTPSPAVFPGIKKANNTPGVIPPGDSVLKNDQVLTQVPPPVVLPDTTAKQIPPPVLVSAPPVKNDTVQKKPKGVRGITDGDYRIVPKKDTSGG